MKKFRESSSSDQAVDERLETSDRISRGTQNIRVDNDLGTKRTKRIREGKNNERRDMTWMLANRRADKLALGYILSRSRQVRVG